MKLRKRVCAACVFAAVLGAFLFQKRGGAQSGLQITYGSQGIQTLTYRGQALEDLSRYAGDAFHIWHMKSTDMLGRSLTNRQYGWGEANNSRTWDAATHTMTYQFIWGSISTRFVQNGDRLDIQVTEVNKTGSGIQFCGATIYPLALHFPQLPIGFVNAAYNQFAFNTTGPSVTVADYGTAEVASAMTDAAKPLYSGFQATDGSPTYTPIISSTSPDALAAFQPHNDRVLAPGQTDQFTVSLRFAPSGTPAAALAADVYATWAATWPAQLKWTDRRIIGTVYLASSGPGNANQPAGYSNNPRRYFNDGNADDFDIRTPGGLVRFQRRILKQAADVVTNLRRLNAQGVLTWDIEGEQYPMSTSYVCSPDQIAAVSPEMESAISDTSSPYVGMKLDDAYFRTIREAGFRVGVCVRPQNFVLNGDGTAQQVTIANSADVTTQLIRKMRYAHDRWGATLFYIDSSVDGNGGTLTAAIFQQVAAALSDSLLIPEESTFKHYAYTAPFLTFLFHGDLGTDAAVYNSYPSAFSANLINDVDPNALALHRADLTASVKRGDVLMVHADSWHPNNDTVLQMYVDAGRGNTSAPTQPVSTPPPTAPVVAPPPPAASGLTIVSPSTGSTISGTVQVTGSITRTLDAAGSYLMVDGAELGTTRLSNGPFIYSFDTTKVVNGTHMLQLWAHDTGNETLLSDTATVTVANGNATGTSSGGTTAPITPSVQYPITLTYPVSGQALTGVVSVAATIPGTLDASGSYLTVDGQQYGDRRVINAPFEYTLNTGTLSNGVHQLQIWAHDIGNNNLLSNVISVLVQH